MSVRRSWDGPAAGEPTVAADDVIVVRGDAESVSRIVVDKCLAVGTQPMAGVDGAALLSRELGVAEVVVPPRSALVGQTVFPGMVRRQLRSAPPVTGRWPSWPAWWSCSRPGWRSPR